MATHDRPQDCDIAVVGAGAAGLMAAIWAGRTAREGGRNLRILALDGAAKLGAKILVAGGGRCNVTHFEVDERQFAGSTPPAIRKVLGRFEVARVVEFFQELGVQLKREETGKLFPVTDQARTVLDAILGEARRVGVELRHPWRVARVQRRDDGFSIEPEVSAPNQTIVEPILARRVVLATGGKALPRTGSDGRGYEILRELGHTVTPRVFPALVPLLLEKGHWLTALSGLTFPATLEVRSSTGKAVKQFTNSTLLTHWGLSGPSVMDISRYWIDARLDDPAAQLVLNFVPRHTPHSFDSLLVEQARSPQRPSLRRMLQDQLLPERLADAIAAAAGVPPAVSARDLSKEQRRRLALAATQCVLPVTGDRGYTYAEATAGGVPLAELHLATMESRVCPGLSVCGEVCDVDGRIGGFNFQWAWASGFVAGTGAAASALESPDSPGD